MYNITTRAHTHTHTHTHRPLETIYLLNPFPFYFLSNSGRLCNSFSLIHMYSGCITPPHTHTGTLKTIYLLNSFPFYFLSNSGRLYNVLASFSVIVGVHNHTLIYLTLLSHIFSVIVGTCKATCVLSPLSSLLCVVLASLQDVIFILLLPSFMLATLAGSTSTAAVVSNQSRGTSGIGFLEVFEQPNCIIVYLSSHVQCYTTASTSISIT